ncbi:MAG: lysoplasmalogenase [Candidatus Neomarinimicrobiota bacterium]
MIILTLTLLLPFVVILLLRADYSNRRRQVYVLKPLATGLVLLICLLQPPEIGLLYRRLIVAGLLFSLLGDIFLMLPADRFIHGLASFLATHILYFAAFVATSGIQLRLIPLAPILLLGLGFLRLLLPHTRTKTIPVIFYAVVLTLLLWQATGRLLLTVNHSTILALIGTAVFIFSDCTLVINRFVSRFRSAQIVILTSYYLAQLCIAYSV